MRELLSADGLPAPDRVEYDEQQLRDYYRNHGFYDFRVVSAVAELESGNLDAACEQLFGVALAVVAVLGQVAQQAGVGVHVVAGRPRAGTTLHSDCDDD